MKSSTAASTIPARRLPAALSRPRPSPGPKARAWARLAGKRRRPPTPWTRARPVAVASADRSEDAPDDRPSVRVVCLLGLAHVPRPGPEWTPGESLTWSGRAYRVEATQARNPGYVHLAAIHGDERDGAARPGLVATADRG